MEGFFLANINIDGKGGVVASPSTSEPNYYYHWQRDGAISMRELMNIRTIVVRYTVYVCMCLFTCCNVVHAVIVS